MSQLFAGKLSLKFTSYVDPASIGDGRRDCTAGWSSFYESYTYSGIIGGRGGCGWPQFKRSKNDFFPRGYVRSQVFIPLHYLLEQTKVFRVTGKGKRNERGVLFRGGSFVGVGTHARYMRTNTESEDLEAISGDPPASLGFQKCDRNVVCSYHKGVMMSMWVPDGSYGQHEHIDHIWSAWYFSLGWSHTNMYTSHRCI